MATNKWVYSPVLEQVRNGADIVFYCESMSPGTIQDIVGMYNDGKNLVQIKDFLQTDTRCTDEEAVQILDEITNYLTVSKADNPSEQEQVVQVPILKPGESITIENKGRSDIKVIETKPEESTVPKKKYTRVISPAKKSIAELKAELNEKLELLEIFEKVEIVLIPVGTNLSVTGKKLIQEFQKQQESLVGEYMDKIEKM